VTVTTPPRRPETEQDRDLEQRVADLEALIEEARRRARRRRRRNWGAALLVAAAGAAAFIGFGGRGGGGAGTAALAHAPGSQAPAANADSAPLGALPLNAGNAESFAFDPRNPEIVYVLTVSYSNGFARSHVFKTTDDGAHWQATATSGTDWLGSKEALTADPRHPGTLYASTELAVYKTVDGGNSWRPSNHGLFPPPRATFQFNRDKGWVIALAVDPAKTNIVYAGSDRVSKSTDGGHSWKTVFPPHPTPYPRDNVSALAIAASRPMRSTRSRATSRIRRRHLRTDVSRSTSRPTPVPPGRRQRSFAGVSATPHSPSIRTVRPPSTRPSVPMS
jgi:hypothetical protein